MDTYAVIYTDKGKPWHKCAQFRTLEAAEAWAAKMSRRLDIVCIEMPDGLTYAPRYRTE